MSTRDNDAFWGDIEKELKLLPKHLSHGSVDSRTVERLREFVERQDDSDLFFHRSPKRVADGIRQGGYQDLDDPLPMPGDVRAYLDRP